MIDDLVSNFLYPEVLRQKERRDAAADDSKFATASSRFLEAVMGDVEARLEQ